MADIEFENRDGVGLITFARPDTLNVFSPGMMAGLGDLYRHCDADEAVRVVVVTGRGAAFCAGRRPLGRRGVRGARRTGLQFLPAVHAGLGSAQAGDRRLQRTRHRRRARHRGAMRHAHRRARREVRLPAEPPRRGGGFRGRVVAAAADRLRARLRDAGARRAHRRRGGGSLAPRGARGAGAGGAAARAGDRRRHGAATARRW